MELSKENKESLRRLIRYLEENLRASSIAGLDYIDPRDFTNRFLSKQNHVIFGRRGAGKSMLIKSIMDKPDFINISINLEDLKDISFPNIIIKVMQEAYEKIVEEIDKSITSLWFLKFREEKN